jgi:hypothetical protein
MHLCNADIDSSAIAYGAGCLHNRGNPVGWPAKLTTRIGAVYMRLFKPLPVRSPCPHRQVPRFDMTTLLSTPRPACSAAQPSAEFTPRLWRLALGLEPGLALNLMVAAALM